MFWEWVMTAILFIQVIACMAFWVLFGLAVYAESQKEAGVFLLKGVGTLILVFTYGNIWLDYILPVMFNG